MSRIRIFYTRLRKEEKLLVEAAEREGIPYSLEDAREVHFGVTANLSDDVILCRCIGHSQNIALAHFFEGMRQRVVNPASVMERCGDKLATTMALGKMNIPQPAFRFALSPEAALSAAEELGYPVVFKPLTGSWGRLLAKANDKDAAEAIIEHKFNMGSQHQVFYVQEYVEKRGYDVRAFVVGGEPIAAIRRLSDHWITNTARGAKAVVEPVDGELGRLLRRVHAAVGGDVLAVDVFPTDDRGWLVNEVNDGAEFRNSIEPTGVDIPGEIMHFCWNLCRGLSGELAFAGGSL
jgi:[lysine-biosynthesis-protein LysW]--L-2-aminoadipate ligase